MNRAAEQAAPLAKPIFGNAIKTIHFDDARDLLTGGETAITDFFRKKTCDPLAVAFRPPVGEVMGQVGATRQYNELVGRFQKIPFAGKLAMVNIEEYVVSKALDGLCATEERAQRTRFGPAGGASSSPVGDVPTRPVRYMVAQEEKQIRKNPAARVTSVLKDIFGKR